MCGYSIPSRWEAPRSFLVVVLRSKGAGMVVVFFGHAADAFVFGMLYVR